MRRQQRSIRFSEATLKNVEAAARKRGFSSSTAFIRYAVEQELLGRNEELTSAEGRIAASFDQVRREQFRLMRVHQALFALVDTLSKTLLTCVPEPPADARPQAIARAKERYHLLMKTAGISMRGESKLAMDDLVECLDK